MTTSSRSFSSQFILCAAVAVMMIFQTDDSVAASGDLFRAKMAEASNSKLSMNQRWIALQQSVQYAGNSQIAEIRKFTEHPEWYMRNASLVALNKLDPSLAVLEARKLVSDKALVVRSAAVEILAENLNEQNKKILMDEFAKKYNFHKKSSLWIRSQIIEKIAAQATYKDRIFFAEALFDSDQQVSELSARALEKITGEKISGKKLTESWRKHVKNQNWVSGQ